MKKTLIAAAALLLAACALNVETPAPARYAYKDYPVQTLNVGSIKIVEAYRQPMQMPNVEHLMPDPLPHAVADFARTRFRAGGGSGVLTITVRTASVVTQDLARHTGLTGLFNVDQAQRFEGHVNLDFSVSGADNGASGTRGGSAEVNVVRGLTLGEDATIADRDATLTTLGEQIMTDVDAGTQQMFQRRLPFLAQGGSVSPAASDAPIAGVNDTSASITSSDLSDVQPESKNAGYN